MLGRRLGWPAALGAGAALAIGYGGVLVWSSWGCVRPLVVQGAPIWIAIPLALALPLGLLLAGGSRRWSGALLALVGVLPLLTVAGFLTACASTGLLALVGSVVAPRRSRLAAIAAAGLAVLAVRFGLRSAAQCAAMEEAVAQLVELDGRCAGAANGPIRAGPSAGLESPVHVSCLDRRATLLATPVLPISSPMFFLHLSFDRDAGRWRLAD